MSQRQSSFAKVQNDAVEAEECGEEEEEEVVFTAPVENSFGILPEEDGGDVEEFIEEVAVWAKKVEEEEKKQRQERKAEAKTVQQQQPQMEQQQFLTASVRAKRPIVPKWIYRSQIVFRKPKPEEDQEQQQHVGGGIGDQEHGKNVPPGRKGLANNIDRRSNSRDTGFRGRGRRGANGYPRNNGEGYQQQQEGNCQEKDSRNYQYNNGEERRDHKHGYYQGRYIGERMNDQKKNYRRGGNYYFDQRNDDQDYHRSSRGKGGQGQKWRLIRTSNLSSSDQECNCQDQENGKTAVVQEVFADDVSEKKGLDAVEGEVNGYKESSSVSVNAGGGKAENSKDLKKKNKRNEGDSDKKSQEERTKETENTMTYKEYQKVLLEKKNALDKRLNAGNFEPILQPIEGDKEGSSKTKSGQDLSKKEDAVKKKVFRSVSINDFLKPAEGTGSSTSVNSPDGLSAGKGSNAGKSGKVNGGGHGYQGNYRPNYVQEGNGRGYHRSQSERTGSGHGGRGFWRGGWGFSGQLPAPTRPENMALSPDFQDIVQFPALGETPK